MDEVSFLNKIDNIIRCERSLSRDSISTVIDSLLADSTLITDQKKLLYSYKEYFQQINDVSLNLSPFDNYCESISNYHYKLHVMINKASLLLNQGKVDLSIIKCLDDDVLVSIADFSATPYFCSRVFTLLFKSYRRLGNVSKTNSIADLYHKFTSQNFENDVPNSLSLLALAHHDMGRLDDALTLYLKALNAFKVKNDPTLHAQYINTLINTGELYRDRGDYREALKCYDQVISSSNEMDQISKAIAEHNMGLVHISIGEVRKGIRALHKSYNRVKYLSKVYSCLFLGNLAYEYYVTLGKPHNAKIMFEECFVYYSDLGIEEELVKNLCNYCELLSAEFKQFDKVAEILQKAIDLATQHKSDIELSLVYFVKALLNYHQHDLGEAKEWLQKAKSLAAPCENFSVVLRSSIYSAEIELIKYRATREDIHYQTAEELLTEAKMAATRRNMIVRFIQIQITQSMLLTAKYHYDDAIKQLKEALELSDKNQLSFFSGILEERIQYIESQKNNFKISHLGTKESSSSRYQTINPNAVIDALDSIEEIHKLAKIVTPIVTENDFWIFIYKQAAIGPTIAVKDQQIPEFFTEDTLTKMGVIYSVAIGQGTQWHYGLFGPLPVPGDSVNYSSLIYSTCLTNKSMTDIRIQKRSYLMIVIAFRQQIGHELSNNMEKISKEIQKVINSVQDTSDVTYDILSVMKRELLGIFI